jgi:phosphoglycerate dehydrogenase-like enzyme
VVLTPHAAGVDRQSLADMALSAAQAAVDVLAGNWPMEKIVNRELARED